MASGAASMTIRVALVDDQDLVRTGLKLVLEGEDDIEVVGEAADGRQGVSLVRRLQPDVVLMDIRMRGTDGIEATRELAGPDARSPAAVLILTTYDMDEYVFEALRAGARGFLLKHASPEELVQAVRTVAVGDGIVAPAVARRVIEAFARQPAVRSKPAELQSLTEREHAVLELVARGRSNAEIAAELFVEPSTVKTHIGNLLAKLGVRDRIQVVIYAYEHGVIQPGA